MNHPWEGETWIANLLLISLLLLLCSAAAALWRLFRGPLLTDRVVALDHLGMIFVGAMVVTAMYWRQAVYLDAVMAYAMVSFLATIGIARYLESKGNAK